MLVEVPGRKITGRQRGACEQVGGRRSTSNVAAAAAKRNQGQIVMFYPPASGGHCTGHLYTISLYRARPVRYTYYVIDFFTIDSENNVSRLIHA